MAKIKKPGHSQPVGYRRPPSKHKIKPGEVRNPYGRKGKPKPAVDFLDELFEIKLKDGGRSIKTTRDGAIDHFLFKEAHHGNVSAAKELDRRRRERAAAVQDEAPLAILSDDEMALARFVERYLLDREAPEVLPSPSPTPARGFVPGVKK